MTSDPDPIREVESLPCRLPPPGWFCSRGHGHPGPCAAYTVDGGISASFHHRLLALERLMYAEGPNKPSDSDKTQPQLTHLQRVVQGQADTISELKMDVGTIKEQAAHTTRVKELEDRVATIECQGPPQTCSQCQSPFNQFRCDAKVCRAPKEVYDAMLERTFGPMPKTGSVPNKPLPDPGLETASPTKECREEWWRGHRLQIVATAVRRMIDLDQTMPPGVRADAESIFSDLEHAQIRSKPVPKP